MGAQKSTSHISVTPELKSNNEEGAKTSVQADIFAQLLSWEILQQFLVSLRLKDSNGLNLWINLHVPL